MPRGIMGAKQGMLIYLLEGSPVRTTRPTINAQHLMVFAPLGQRCPEVEL
jgi:hypothetical protein